jgi:hypothetical protein
MDYEDEIDDEYEMKNPNLYIELTTSGQGGFLTTEAGGPILAESLNNLITQNG